ncbi:MAG TPA: S8/S53 family peptidase [Candidatus Thermoplasmatota archaeon]|nr:S8/S53 family peptidase [Candidatus Thermoplasmatota archaeon]
MTAILLSGCLGPDTGAAEAPDASAVKEPSRPTVVALIDSGINVYHEAFQARPGFVIPPEARASAVSVPLAPAGSYADRRAADDPFWTEVEAGTLYSFPGTRVLAITFGRYDFQTPILDEAEGSHGTGTASLVAREDPDAVIVMIQVQTSLCIPYERPECHIDRSIVEGMKWASAQPWIDIISVSLGVHGNAPGDPRIYPEVAEYLAATRAAAASGKLVVNGGGNTVGPPLASHFNGPPWIISVGGYEPSMGGERIEAGKYSDVVANFTEIVAREGSIDEYRVELGTSFGTPLVSGVLSRALGLVRAANPETALEAPILAARLRAALNHSAATVGAEAWAPLAGAENLTTDPLSAVALPVAAPAQAGWGYVTGAIVPEMVRRVLEGDDAVPADKIAAASGRAAVQAAREAYWLQYA